jgi:D-glycerate 3-kinase
MTLKDLLEAFDLAHRQTEADALCATLPGEAPEDWRHLAVVMALRIADRDRPGAVLGISGGQGAGKTTLSRLLVTVLSGLEIQAVSLSLDDFYLTHQQREVLARDVHPLLGTRGVPGTHDVALAVDVITALKSGESAECPVFDKALDDRDPSPRLLGPGVAVVIFEGWCVGVPPQALDVLHTPCNDLERDEDPAGLWRGYVNDRLIRDYPALWGLIDELLYLQVPDMPAVVRWRTEQELGLPAGQRMDPETLQRFVEHYQRLTLWMQSVLPEIAQVVGFIDKNHRLADLVVH